MKTVIAAVFAALLASNVLAQMNTPDTPYMFWQKIGGVQKWCDWVPTARAQFTLHPTVTVNLIGYGAWYGGKPLWEVALTPFGKITIEGTVPDYELTTFNERVKYFKEKCPAIVAD